MFKFPQYLNFFMCNVYKLYFILPVASPTYTFHLANLWATKFTILGMMNRNVQIRHDDELK